MLECPWTDKVGSDAVPQGSGPSSMDTASIATGQKAALMLVAGRVWWWELVKAFFQWTVFLFVNRKQGHRTESELELK